MCKWANVQIEQICTFAHLHIERKIPQVKPEG